MSDLDYFVFIMKNKAHNYVVEFATCHGKKEVDYKFNAENAKIILEQMKEVEEHDKAIILTAEQFGTDTKEQILDKVRYHMQPLELTRPYVVVNKNNRMWNMYSDKNCALATVEDKNKPEQKYPSDLLEQPFKIITWPEYNKAEKEKYITAPVQISEKRYWELLECLPPKNWHTAKGGLDVFFMSEFQTGSYTEQLIKWGVGDETTYYSKGVDYCDKSTWCTLIDLQDVKTCEAP